MDLNNDGKLSKEELRIGYEKIMNPHEAAEEVEKIMQMVDKNNSGLIDYSGKKCIILMKYRICDGNNK